MTQKESKSTSIKIPQIFLPLLSATERYIGAHGGRGTGKCLAIGTKVLMADGSVLPVEDVKFGDRVMGPDGTPRNVLGTTRGIGEMFQVTQKGAGSYVVNDAHLISLRKNKTYKFARTANVLNVTCKEYISWNETKKCSFSGYKANAIELQKESLPIPPYILGIWLGDGNSRRQDITSMDEEIISEFVAWGKTLGCHEVRNKKPGQRACTIILTNVQGQKNNAKEAFRSLGVLHNKHVPEIYHKSTISDRLEFLAGFIDTDGSYENGGFNIIQKNESMARSLKRIADGLGFKTSIRIRNIKVNGERRPYFKVSINGDVDKIPTRLPRKQAVTNKNKDWHIGKLDVISVGLGEYAGFELDGDHLFCLDNGIVTHNSNFFATMLILKQMQKKTDVVALREVHRSIKQSVKRLIEAKIDEYGFGPYFCIQDQIIYHRGNGSLTIFGGLQNHTAESIKSLESFDIAWIEEAQSVSQRSLDILRPTMRKPGSQIWCSWNPEFETDPIDVLLRGQHPPSSSRVIKVNPEDNPWFPNELKEEMREDYARDPGRAKWVWAGEYRSMSDSLIFRNWKVEAFEAPEGTLFRYGADWGYSVDPSVLIRCYQQGRTLFIDYEAYEVGCEIDRLPDLFFRVPESEKWPIAADSSRPETIGYLQKHGFPRLFSAIKGAGSVEAGVQWLQAMNIVVHPRCVNTRKELSLYSYKLDPTSGKPIPILEDKNNHVIDAIRYASEALRRAANQPKIDVKPIPVKTGWAPKVNIHEQT